MLDAQSNCRVAALSVHNLTIYYHSGKHNVDACLAYKLSQILTLLIMFFIKNKSFLKALFRATIADVCKLQVLDFPSKDTDFTV